MIDDFDSALKFVLNAEGGYVDDPDDPGGATNLGIEQVEYDAWRRGLREPVRSVKLITESEAASIYKSRYWDTVHGDYTAKPIAFVLFDTAVNTGCGTAIEELQECLNIGRTGSFDKVTSMTYSGYINSRQPPQDLASKILDLRVAYYHRISTERPKLAKFLDGWLSRVEKLRAVIIAS
jgi:lysozyme family protein